MADLKGQIARRCYRAKHKNDYPNWDELNSLSKEEYLEKADAILALLEQGDELTTENIEKLLEQSKHYQGCVWLVGIHEAAIKIVAQHTVILARKVAKAKRETAEKVIDEMALGLDCDEECGCLKCKKLKELRAKYLK